MANFIPEQEKYKKLTPFKLHCVTQFPYIDADFDALTNWELLCKVVNYLNTVIDNENKVEENVSNLYDAYVELKNYIDSYFGTELQNKVNNKLDEMSEDGTLDSLLSKYIDNNVQRVYNSFELLKIADIDENIKVRTLGYYSINDGGGATYIIRNVQPQSVYYETLDNGKYAELVNKNEINIKQLGAKSDTVTDNSSILQYAINNYDKVIIPKGTYIIANTINLRNGVLIFGESKNNYATEPASYLKITTDKGFVGSNITTSFNNIGFVGNNKENTCFYDTRVMLKNCSLSNFNYSLEYIKASIIESCDIFNNNQGIRGCADSRIINNFINANGEGIYLVEGSNDNIITNNKIEWNTSNGIRGTNSTHNVINNNLFDRNTNSGIFLYLCNKTNIVGNFLRRNCIDTTTSVNSGQILISQCDHMIINSNITATGTLLDGSGATIPQRALQIQSSNNLTFIGNDFTGGTSSTPIVKYSNQENSILWINNNGIDFITLLKNSSITSKQTAYINNGANRSFEYNVGTIANYSSIYKKFRIKYNTTDNLSANTIDIYVTILNRVSSTLVSVNGSIPNVSITGTYNNEKLTLNLSNTSSNIYIEVEELTF